MTNLDMKRSTHFHRTKVKINEEIKKKKFDSDVEKEEKKKKKMNSDVDGI